MKLTEGQALLQRMFEEEEAKKAKVEAMRVDLALNGGWALPSPELVKPKRGALRGTGDVEYGGGADHDPAATENEVRLHQVCCWVLPQR